MSLLTDQMEKCTLLNATSNPDDYGGFETSWVPGEDFYAAAVLDNSLQAKIAEKSGVTALYTITTQKEVNLQYHDVFKRARDGKIFRVTSDGDDKFTPMSAHINMRQVSAEEWELPNNE